MSLDVQRATPLVRNQTVTEREFDSRRGTQRDAAGQVSAAKASLKQAELNLEWTEVRARSPGASPIGVSIAGNLITGGPSAATC